MTNCVKSNVMFPTGVKKLNEKCMCDNVGRCLSACCKFTQVYDNCAYRYAVHIYAQALDWTVVSTHIFQALPTVHLFIFLVYTW